METQTSSNIIICSESSSYLASNISRVISFWKIHYHILLFRHCINVVAFQTNHDTRCKSSHKFPAWSSVYHIAFHIKKISSSFKSASVGLVVARRDSPQASPLINTFNFVTTGMIVMRSTLVIDDDNDDNNEDDGDGDNDDVDNIQSDDWSEQQSWQLRGFRDDRDPTALKPSLLSWSWWWTDWWWWHGQWGWWWWRSWRRRWWWWFPRTGFINAIIKTLFDFSFFIISIFAYFSFKSSEIKLFLHFPFPD